MCPSAKRVIWTGALGPTMAIIPGTRSLHISAAPAHSKRPLDISRGKSIDVGFTTEQYQHNKHYERAKRPVQDCSTTAPYPVCPSITGTDPESSVKALYMNAHIRKPQHTHAKPLCAPKMELVAIPATTRDLQKCTFSVKCNVPEKWFGRIVHHD